MLGLKIENMDFTKSSKGAFELVWNTNIMPLNLYRKDESVKFLDVTPDPHYETKENIRVEVTKWPHLDETSDIVKRAGATYVMNVTVDKDRDGGGTDPEPTDPTIKNMVYDRKTKTFTADVTGVTEVKLTATAGIDGEVTAPVTAGKVKYVTTDALRGNTVIEIKADTVSDSYNVSPLFLKAQDIQLGWDSNIELGKTENTLTFSIVTDNAPYVPGTVSWSLTGDDKFVIDAATGKVTITGFAAGDTANIEVNANADGDLAMTRAVVTRTV